jgi:putative hydrolase of the HAD superfamily
VNPHVRGKGTGLVQPTALFFDLDHTLQDLDSAFDRALPETLQALGPAFRGLCSSEALRGRLDAVWPGVWQAFLDGALSEEELYANWFGAALADVGLSLDRETLAKGVVKTYLERFEAHLALFDDVLPALQRIGGLEPRPLLAILTNGPGPRQRRRIARLGLAPFFPVQLISGELKTAKPDPDFFRIALERAFVRPEEAVMIGDDPRNDVVGAKEVGIRAVWLNRQGAEWPAELAVRPDAERATLTDAVEWCSKGFPIRHDPVREGVRVPGAPGVSHRPV